MNSSSDLGKVCVCSSLKGEVLGSCKDFRINNFTQDKLGIMRLGLGSSCVQFHREASGNGLLHQSLFCPQWQFVVSMLHISSEEEWTIVLDWSGSVDSLALHCYTSFWILCIFIVFLFLLIYLDFILVSRAGQGRGCWYCWSLWEWWLRPWWWWGACSSDRRWCGGGTRVWWACWETSGTWLNINYM